MRADRFDEMAAFAKVVDEGSFSGAARALRLTPSAVSKLIARLEGRLGARLFARSTRALVLTPEGETFHRSCIDILDRVDEAERAVAPPATPRGRVRVNSAVPLGRRLILPFLPDFLARYPHVEVDVTLTDAVVDLLAEGVDIAVRAGPLVESALTARKLVDSPRVIVGSPDYLARCRMPQAPGDLSSHDCLTFNFRRAEEGWPFRIGGIVRRMAVRGPAKAGDGETLRTLALAGVGLARLAGFHVREDIAAGRLVPVLEAYNPGDREPVHIVFSGGRAMPSRVRAFIDFVAERSAQLG